MTLWRKVLIRMMNCTELEDRHFSGAVSDMWKGKGAELVNKT